MTDVNFVIKHLLNLSFRKHCKLELIIPDPTKLRFSNHQNEFNFIIYSIIISIIRTIMINYKQMP